ncbi:ATP-binding protein [Ramlibacter albus]|uniref:histidine kinase n=1 Tax=Ramlibacter albus TaxID=2079448 RepID=A0A923M5T8_9BURK|nr:ATP-binding protein [Ramlibacter albus]MBC5763301.1 HAMP domain-containing protein [Ramlibacter albus]
MGRWLGRLSLATKLLLAPAVGIVALAIVAAGAYWGLAQQRDTISTLNDVRFSHLQLALEASAFIQEAHQQLDEALAAAGGERGALARLSKDEVLGKLKTALPTLEYFSGQGLDPREQEVIQATMASLRRYVAMVEQAFAAQQIDALTERRLESAFGVVSWNLTRMVGVERELTDEAFAQSRERSRWLLVAFSALLLLALLAALGATVVVTRHVRSKVEAIHSAAADLAGGNLTRRAEVSSDDEIGRTARAFNYLVDELQRANARVSDEMLALQQRTGELREAQEALVTAARRAGMAEIATNVLHNVGNVLNSVNVATGLIRRTVEHSKAEGLGKVAQMLEGHEGDLAAYLQDDPKGKLLPRYLGQLAKALAAERASLLEDLARLGASVDHIKEIVAMQQSYAGFPASVIESIRVQDLVDDALRMNAESFKRSGVTVVKEIADVPPLALDKHRMLLIMVNLINNAKQAVSGSGGRAPEIRLKVDLADGPKLRVLVADKGEGIAPENLTRIFAHGFTTRRDGHGFGLHSCALAAMEMGGKLTAHSEGAGQGATFTLEIPVAAAARP